MNRPWYRFYDKGVPRTIDYPLVSLPDLVSEKAREYADKIAIHFMKRDITYAQFQESIDRLANALYSIGVRKGDRVALMLPNSPQFMIAFYAVLKIGGIVVQTNPLYTVYELEHILKDSEAETLITLAVLRPKVEAVKDKTPLKRVIYTSLASYMPTLLGFGYKLRMRLKGLPTSIPKGRNIYTFSELINLLPPEPPKVEINPKEDVALFQYTGGTTGLPKAAMLTHFNLVANAYQTIHWIPNLEWGKEVILAVLPFFHVYGMTVAMNFSTLTGSKIILVPRFNPRKIVKLIQKHRVTLFPGAPRIYIEIINLPDVQNYDLTSVKACISGSAPLPVKVKEEFERLTGAKLVEGYGLSEASPVTHANPILGVNKAGSIGLPFPDTDAKIVDPETGEREMPVGEPGELIVKGPQVMKGYWKRPEETAKTIRDGWLYTGDIAKMDEDGYFYIVDRKKDMIIVSGFNVYPREVEEVLFKHPKIKEAAVIGVPDPKTGERVKAFVVLKEGESMTAEEVMEYCLQYLARYKCPKEVEFVDDLPKSFIGKVLRRVLREEEEKKRGG